MKIGVVVEGFGPADGEAVPWVFHRESHGGKALPGPAVGKP